MDWTNPGVSESTEEEEAEMSSLVSCFSERMRKQAASSPGVTASASGTEVPNGKHPKLTSPDEEA